MMQAIAIHPKLLQPFSDIIMSNQLVQSSLDSVVEDIDKAVDGLAENATNSVIDTIISLFTNLPFSNKLIEFIKSKLEYLFDSIELGNYHGIKEVLAAALKELVKLDNQFDEYLSYLNASVAYAISELFALIGKKAPTTWWAFKFFEISGQLRAVSDSLNATGDELAYMVDNWDEEYEQMSEIVRDLINEDLPVLKEKIAQIFDNFCISCLAVNGVISVSLAYASSAHDDDGHQMKHFWMDFVKLLVMN